VAPERDHWIGHQVRQSIQLSVDSRRPMRVWLQGKRLPLKTRVERPHIRVLGDFHAGRRDETGVPRISTSKSSATMILPETSPAENDLPSIVAFPAGMGSELNTICRSLFESMTTVLSLGGSIPNCSSVDLILSKFSILLSVTGPYEIPVVVSLNCVVAVVAATLEPADRTETRTSAVIATAVSRRIE